MLYIHQTNCISPQQTFLNADIEVLHEPVEQKLKVIEPEYEGIPPGLLRRMGKAVRIAVGAALPLLKRSAAPDGFIIGTADGAMEDSIKFLNQIIQYEEGQLTPGNFVQSTLNAIASQLGLLSNNKGYNITHVHRGLAFEYAVIDAMMLLNENPRSSYLLGAVDEISTYNYNIDLLCGWFKEETVTGKNFYEIDSPGSIAGEGAAMFLVNRSKENAIAGLTSVHTIHSEDEGLIREQLKYFLAKYLPQEEKIDLLLSGENGDSRLAKYFSAVENMMDKETTVARFKHMTGEYATASAVAVWLACNILETQAIPAHMIKTQSSPKEYKNLLIYNTHKIGQHGFMLLTR